MNKFLAWRVTRHHTIPLRYSTTFTGYLFFGVLLYSALFAEGASHAVIYSLLALVVLSGGMWVVAYAFSKPKSLPWIDALGFGMIAAAIGLEPAQVLTDTTLGFWVMFAILTGIIGSGLGFLGEKLPMALQDEHSSWKATIRIANVGMRLVLAFAVCLLIAWLLSQGRVPAFLSSLTVMVYLWITVLSVAFQAAIHHANETLKTGVNCF